jgi:hypothetical protein
MKMIRHALKHAALLALLLSSTAAYADDPTGILLQQQRASQGKMVPAAVGFSDVGPCEPGTQSIAFPNRQGFRCVPSRQ